MHHIAYTSKHFGTSCAQTLESDLTQCSTTDLKTTSTHFAQNMVPLVLPGHGVAFLPDQTIPEYVDILSLS